jgi:hypothetical protein
MRLDMKNIYFLIMLLLLNIQIMTSDYEGAENFSPEVRQQIGWLKEWLQEAKEKGNAQQMQNIQAVLELTARTPNYLNIPDAEYVDKQCPSYCQECLISTVSFGMSMYSARVYGSSAPDDCTTQCLSIAGVVLGIVGFQRGVIKSVEKYENYYRWNKYCKMEHRERLARLADSKKMK